MDEITSTTNRRPAPRRPRMSKSTMPDIPAVSAEFRCDEPTHSQDDVLLSGSDNEYYDSPGERSGRLEEQARLFLQGHRPLLLSTSLRGPFGRETGWENPWIGRHSRIAKGGPSHSSKTRPPPVASASDARTAGRTRTTATRRSSVSGPSAKGLLSSNLDAAPDIAYTDKDPEVKKRAAGADWLRRRNLKRVRPNDDDLTASPTPSRTSKTAAITAAASEPEKSILSRSVSAPVTRQVVPSESDAAAPEDSVGSQPSSRMASMDQSVSHISDSEVAMSLPSELFHASSHGAQQQSPQGPTVLEAEAPIFSDPVKETPIADSSTATMMDDGTTLPTTEDESENEAETELSPNAECSAGDDKPSAEMESRTNTAISCFEAPVESSIAHPDDAATVPCVIDAGVDESKAPAAPPDESGLENSRLATQYQSPWAKTQTSALADLLVSDDSNAVMPVSRTHLEDIQSPWSRETQPQLPGTVPTPEPEFTSPEEPIIPEPSKPSMSLSQNPWADANPTMTSFSSSLSNLPTSPCSPEKDGRSPPPADKSYHDQGQEPFLPSLPIPIPTTQSSGTAPSTPDTKQSSLPTPDMTVSIKSFRRFRSPTPTPPPRRQIAKSGGPRSILSQPRRRSGAVKAASRSGCRVHFDLAQNEDTTLENGCTDLETPDQQRASSPPPQDQTLVDALPTEVDRFKNHFATIAGRAGGQPTSMSATLHSNTARHSKLGTRPVRVYTSPLAGAIATRFQEADEDMTKLQQISASASQFQHPSAMPRLRQGSSDTSSKSIGAHGDDKENITSQRADEQRHVDIGGDDFRPVAADDDVQDVMDNLDDFLGLWDMDAELAQARSVS